MRVSTVDGLTSRRLGIFGPLERGRLEGAQMAALRATVLHAKAGSPWYRERLAGVAAETLRCPADLARLPFVTVADVAAFGRRMVCVPQGEVARIVTLQTSGSTGTPKRLHFTRDDLDGTLDFFLHGMLNLVGQEDRVLALLPFSQPDSTGDLLIRALSGGGVHCAGLWPPVDAGELAQFIAAERYSCLVGLPQHLLALSDALPFGAVRTMLLCSDYAPPALRRRIEEACGCETFLHYGATETGLGGGVECEVHDGCHLRESDLLFEIVDPVTGAVLGGGEEGEVVVTTLGRRAMPLLRYRTGDLARLAKGRCACGGVTARLCDVTGRGNACVLGGGFSLTSRELDDRLFDVEGLLDYRATLESCAGADRLGVEFRAGAGHEHLERDLGLALRRVPGVAAALELGSLSLAPMRRVEVFSPSHTVKRTINDQRGSTL
ncbi:DVU_1553 family AMP-dependent CoA ligase [Desulfomicrobium escambiense]|uniref:DVU_1553 family AMP-dependent CoA ligase n=1 Tax=Desulfomicrobium escambiense TaxID=29503 RepID=UPI000688140E|nr:AMP-binding protein [Desulfomicrobium escambiense]